MTDERHSSPSDVQFFQEGLLAWYAEHKRDLPWRRTTDPYHILVSEIMLQQTQVDRVIPKYLAWLERFPTVHELAAASVRDVITLWSGLGYNSRAVRLQKTAQALVLRDGMFPRTPQGLESLPGIGPYTARAVLSFAFNDHAPVVDTNVRRVFSRLFFSGSGDGTAIDSTVSLALPHGRARDWNNALMDFGSLICTAKSPSCSVCPFREECTAFAEGNQEEYFRIAPPQKKFVGSRRQHRGMVLRLLQAEHCEGLEIEHLSTLLGKPLVYTQDIIRELERDGLVSLQGDLVFLPQ